jgi:hypothetical protein
VTLPATRCTAKKLDGDHQGDPQSGTTEMSPVVIRKKANMLRRWSLVSLALTVVLLAVSCTSIRTDYTAKEYIPDKYLDILTTIPAKYLESVEFSLNEAGENAPELIKVMSTLKGRELEWACFLIGTMPFSDLISIKADYLL